MQHHPDQTLFRAQDPLRIHQGWRQTLLAIAMGLMAGPANGRIDFTTPVETGFGDRRQCLHVGCGQGVRTGRLARPEIERLDLQNLSQDLGIGGTTQRHQSFGFASQLRLLDSRSRSPLGGHRYQASESVQQGRQWPLVVLEFGRQVQGRRNLGRSPRSRDASGQLGHQWSMVLLVWPALGVAEQLGQEGQLAPLETADRRILTQWRGWPGHEQESHRCVGRRRADVSQRTEQGNLSISADGRRALDHAFDGRFPHRARGQIVGNSERSGTHLRIWIVQSRQKGFQVQLPLPFECPEGLKTHHCRRGIALGDQLL